MDTAVAMFARLVRHYRQAAGFSKSECARKVGYTPSYVSKIEAGLRLPDLVTVQDFDEGLGAGGALVAARREMLREADRTGTSIELDDHVDSTDDGEAGNVERRQLLQHALGLTGAAGLAGTLGRLDAVRVTLDDALDRSVEEWQEIAWEYGRDFLALPATDVLEGLSADVLAVRRLLDRPVSADARGDLQRVAAQLSALTAATLGNLGQFTHARRWWRTTRTAADLSGDLELAAWVRAWQAARSLAEGHNPEEVVTMANRALARSPAKVGAGTTAGLAARAQGLAASGDPTAHKAIDEVAEAFERLPGSVRADRMTVYGWSQQRLSHVQSYVYASTGDKRAADAHDVALASYPKGHHQEATRVKLYRAAWLVRTGDPSEGVRYATRALSEIPRQFRDDPVAITARDVERALPAGAEKTPEAVEYRELLALNP